MTTVVADPAKLSVTNTNTEFLYSDPADLSYRYESGISLLGSSRPFRQIRIRNFFTRIQNGTQASTLFYMNKQNTGYEVLAAPLLLFFCTDLWGTIAQVYSTQAQPTPPPPPSNCKKPYFIIPVRRCLSVDKLFRPEYQQPV